MRASRGACVLVAAAVVAAAGVAATTALAGGGLQGPTFGYGRYVREARAFRFCDNFTRQPARFRTCLSDQALWLVVHTRNPARELPRIDRMGPKGAAAACRKASTRYQRYSCVHGLGHAYMRLFGELVGPALGACSALGPTDAADCAQGAFDDYWIAVAGLDQTRRPAGTTTFPRKLCSAQHAQFVRACWYRAWLERP